MTAFDTAVDPAEPNTDDPGYELHVAERELAWAVREHAAIALHDDQAGAVVAELARLRAVEAAALVLVRKLDEHERRGWERIALGALRPLRDALTGGAR